MYFITSSGTGIGKTLVTAALAYQLRLAGKSASVLKPVISGYNENDQNSDSKILLAAQNIAFSKSNIEAISPWRFYAPLAPNIAARMESKEIDYADLLKFCLMPRITQYTIIEGAGGVMSPLTDSRTMLDLISDLKAQVILVEGTYLGSISNALTAASVIKSRGLQIKAVVVSESRESATSVSNVASELRRFIPEADYIVPLPFVAGNKQLWQNVSDLTWILS